MYFFGIVLAVVITDQITKMLAVNYLQKINDIPIIQGFFHLNYVENPGAAFGLLAFRTQFFIVATVLIIFVILYFRRRIPLTHSLVHLGLALQLGGASGNLIDRVVNGYVIDFFDFRIWPVFNIADTAITIGVALLCWEILREGKTGEKKT